MNINIETIQPVDSSNTDNTIYKVYLSGSLDSEESREFETAMNNLINSGAKKIIIDFYELRAIDSMGIGILISSIKKLKKLDGEFIITRCKDQIMTLLKPINIEKLIKIFRNPDDGMQYFVSA